MDYFGWTLWTELFLAHPDWITSMEMGDPNNFDPETDVWSKLFARLANVMKESGLMGKIGACYHISSDIARWTGNFDMFNVKPKYLEARNKFMQNIPFDLGIHCQFSDSVNPLGKEYARTFQEDLDRTLALDSQVIVCHPPYNESYNYQEVMKLLINDVCQPTRLEKLAKTKVALTWENMFEGQFSQLDELLLLVHSIQDRMREQGYPELAKRQQICFDTGHLLIWRAHHFSISHANNLIDCMMPQIGKELRVYHIHGNDGSKDFHIVPFSTLFLNHKTREGLNTVKLLENWETIKNWIRICEANKKLDGRHIHLECDKVPFSLVEYIELAKWYATLLK